MTTIPHTSRFAVDVLDISGAAIPPAPTRVKPGVAVTALCLAAVAVGGIAGVGMARTPPPPPPAVVAAPATNSCPAHPIRGYIASPLIFLPGAFNQGGIMDDVKGEFVKYGFEPITPLDNPANYDRDKIPADKLGEAIAKGDYGLVDKADFVIADLTPWPPDPQGHNDRVPSADSGTTAEAAYALGRGKPVFIFTNNDLPFYQRIKAMHGVQTLTRDPDFPQLQRTPDGIMVENTGGFDNLMLPAIGPLSGGSVHIVKVEDPKKMYTDLRGLDMALQDAQAHFQQCQGK